MGVQYIQCTPISQLLIIMVPVVLSRVRRFIPKMELSEQGQNMELVGEDGPCIEIVIG